MSARWLRPITLAAVDRRAGLLVVPRGEGDPGAEAQDAAGPLPDVPFVAPPAWRVEPLPGAGDIAMPLGCRFERPVGIAPRATAGLRFFAARGARGELAYSVQGDADGPAERGIAAFALAGAAAPVRDIPWWSPLSPPPVAAHEGRWIALVDRPLAATEGEILLWREGRPVETLARGDHLAAVDIRCEGALCAALTTRAARVGAPGATVFVGPGGAAAAATWKASDIGDADPARAARPIAIAGIHDGAVFAALEDRDGIDVIRVAAGAPARGAHLRAHYGLLDVVTMAPHERVPPLALSVSHTDPIDENGCTGAGARITIEREGREPIVVQTSAPPQSAWLRPLGTGAILAWLAPINCRDATRPIVHALLLDAEGAPASSDTSIDDASGFAIETRGPEVEMFLRTREGVKWIRGICGPARAR